MEKISIDQVQFWLGSDVTNWDLLSIIESFANRDYTQKQLYNDISNFMETGEH